MNKKLQALGTAAFTSAHQQGALILDTRASAHFAAGYIAGALNIGLTGDFAVWVGTLIDVDTPILLVVDPGRENEAVEQLSRIGYNNVVGYLQGGMYTWLTERLPIDQVMTFDSSECVELLHTENYTLLDVRNRLEVAWHRMAGSVNIPLNALKNKLNSLEKDKKWLVYCTGGYRGMIAASLMKAHGFKFVATIEGGIKEIIKRAPQLVEMDME